MQFIAIIVAVAFFCVIGSAIGTYCSLLTLTWWNDKKARHEASINHQRRL